jgi:hypothetical protein
MAPASGTQYLLVGADLVLPVERKAEMTPSLPRTDEGNHSATLPQKRGTVTADLVQTGIDENALDPTIPAPMTNVAQYGFEGANFDSRYLAATAGDR